MAIKLREIKQTKNGKISLYLDIYTGKTTDANGKVKYHRQYEFLNLYLIDKPKTEADRTHNKNIRQLADNIRNQRELDFHMSKHGFDAKPSFHAINFFEYFNGVMQTIKGGSSIRMFRTTLNSIKDFAGEDISFGDITSEFGERYLSYLHSKITLRKRNSTPRTIKYHFFVFNTIIKRAIKDKIIVENPLAFIQLPKIKKYKKIYLTFEELKLPCKNG